MQDRLAGRVSLFLFVVTLAVFSRSLTHGFVSYDDPKYVSANPVVQRGLTGEGVAWAFTTFHASNWHPLTWLSHMLDWQVYGPNPSAHYFTSLLLHLANTLGLFLVLWRMTGSLWRPALVAGLFALHPLHVESVVWVAERKDVLSTFFGILALGAYTAYCKRPRVGTYLLVVLAFALSLLAKPMLVTLPCVLLLLDYWPLGRYAGAATPGQFPTARWGWLVLENLPLLALSAASCVITVLAQRAGDAVITAEQLPLGERLANAVVAYVAYLRQTVWPLDLAVFYPHRAGQLPAWQIAAAAFFLLAVTALAFWRRRQTPALLVGWLWYLGTLVPVIGLVQVGTQAQADRYTYVPLIGIFVAVAWAVPTPSSNWRPARLGLTVAVGGILVACTLCTWLQQGYWGSDAGLWRRALQVTANNHIAHLNLGVALYRAGRIDEAEEQFAAAVRIHPAFPLALNNLGTCLARRDRLAEAIALFTKAAVIQPRRALFRNSLGLALARADKLDDAGRQFRAAIDLAPAVAEYRYNLAVTLAEQGKAEEAERAYREGRQLDAAWPQTAERLARELLTTTNPKLRCPGEALFRARQAVGATWGKEPRMLATLAAAYAATGQPARAVAVARRAVETASAAGLGELRQQIEERLRAYEAARADRKPAP